MASGLELKFLLTEFWLNDGGDLFDEADYFLRREGLSDDSDYFFKRETTEGALSEDCFLGTDWKGLESSFFCWSPPGWLYSLPMLGKTEGIIGKSGTADCVGGLSGVELDGKSNWSGDCWDFDFISD